MKLGDDEVIFVADDPEGTGRYVYIHGSFHSVVHTDTEAWTIIKRFPLGTDFAVFNLAGEPLDEFEPF